MKLIQIFKSYWANAFDFKGTARNQEFFLALAVNILFCVILSVLGALLYTGLPLKMFLQIPNLYAILAIVPTISMGKRVCNGIFQQNKKNALKNKSNSRNKNKKRK